jgi:hypothetical protein
LDELHTFDGINLLPLDGLVRRTDNIPLMIREPPAAVVGQQQDFFAPKQAPSEDPGTGGTSIE